jgi:energy-coupling factor transporter ATP-binding protein EcfA2
MFRVLEVTNFPPFGTLKITFPPVTNKPADLGEVHLLTGVNGTGKTRILSVLAAVLGNAEPLRKRLVDKGTLTIAIGEQADVPPAGWPGVMTVGPNAIQWTRQHPPVQWKDKIAAFAYSGTAYVADMPVVAIAALNPQKRHDLLSFAKPLEQSKDLLQGITNLKVQAAMDSQSSEQHAAGSRAVRLVQALENTISKITGTSFRFHVTPYPKVSLQVHWGDANLPFSVLPDGLRSIIGWMVHAVVMMDVSLQGQGDPMTTPAIFLIDEIETNLHPAWQRRILPAFQKLFPRSQIISATHSPFVISSLNHGWIHPFKLLPDGTARVEEIVPASEGDSYLTVLEDIMDLKELYDPETEQLLAKFRQERNAAYHGNEGARDRARQLGLQIGKRSDELQFMMGRELNQMERQLGQTRSE